MKNKINVLICLVMSLSGSAQNPPFDVYGTAINPERGPYSVLTLDTLEGARVLKDLYAKYHADWVGTYISVEITSRCHDEEMKAVGLNDTLTELQLSLLHKADFGCEINVVVDYIPANSLKHNPPRRMNFSPRYIPIFEAKYPGGAQALNQYFRKKVYDKYSQKQHQDIALVKVRFLVDEDGKVVDARVHKTSHSEVVDQTILHAVCNMPVWTPAKNAQGERIVQEFEFSMGSDMLRCDFVY